MANYATLKATIQQYIKQNGNNEITGNLLQQQLLAMINSLGVGYQYMGIATPTTTPGTADQNVFYLASESGTYTNFSGIVVDENEIAFLKWNGVWIKDTLGCAKKEYVDYVVQLANSGDYYLGFPIELQELTSAVTDTTYIFVLKSVGYKHIKQIKFVAKTGTINFYKIYAPTIVSGRKISKTLIASVTNSASENNTIKTIDVDFDLFENEHIGINGSFAYQNFPGNEYTGFNVLAATDTISAPTSGLALGFSAISNVNELSQLIEQRESPLLSQYGDNNIGGTGSTPEFVFITEDATKQYPRYVRYIELELSWSETTICKVTQNGSSYSVEILGSASGNGITKIPLNVVLGNNEKIGIAGYFRYASTGAGDKYSYSYVPIGGGQIHNQGVGSIVCYKLFYLDNKSEETEEINNRTIVVDVSGDGDFTTIHDALAATLGQDSASWPLHIMVMPGVYNEPTLTFAEESLYCNNRYLSIVGVDKENCIIRNDKGYYNGSASGQDNYGDNAPIKINGNVYIANLTIISTDDEATSDANIYHRSYCIHTDAGAQQNSIIEIHNCVLRNNHAPCIGFGIPKNCTLKITNSELYTTLYNPNDWLLGGAIVWGHDRISDPSPTEIQEHVVIKDCILKAGNCHAFANFNNMNGLMDCVFINNAVDVPNDKGIDLGDTTTIDKLSYGNQLVAMNY